MSGAPAGTDASRTAPPGNRSAARAPLQGQHPALAAAAHARPHRSRFGSVVRGLRSVAFFFIRGVPGTAFIIADDEVAYPSRSSWYRFYDGFKRWCIAALLFCGNSSQLLAALVAPISTLLVIPALSQPWYRLRHGTQAPVSDPPVNLVLSAINLFTNTLANAFLLVRFSVADQHIWKVAIRISLFLWIVNLGFAIANLGVFAGGSYRNHDKYEYLEGFWCAVFSCVAAGTVTFLLFFHYVVRFGVMAYRIRLEAVRAAARMRSRNACNLTPELDTEAGNSDREGAAAVDDPELKNARHIWRGLPRHTRRHLRRQQQHIQQKLVDKWEAQQRERDARLSTEGRTFLLSQAALFFSLGIFGFMFSRLEHWTFYNGVYFFLVVTLTVGYGTPHPVTTASKVLLLPTALVSTMLLYNQIGTIVGVLNRFRTNRRTKWRQTFEREIEREQDDLICRIITGGRIPDRDNVPPTADVRFLEWCHGIWKHWHVRLDQDQDGSKRKTDASASSSPSRSRAASMCDHRNQGPDLERARTLFSTPLQERLPLDLGEQVMELETRRLNALTERENQELASTDLAFSIMLMASFLIIGAGIFQGTESWSFGNALYFSYISVLTIGLGDFSPSTAAGRVIWLIYALTAVPIVTSFVVQTIANLVQSGARRISAAQNLKVTKIMRQAKGLPTSGPSLTSQGALMTRFHHQLTNEFQRLFRARDIIVEQKPNDSCVDDSPNTEQDTIQDQDQDQAFDSSFGFEREEESDKEESGSPPELPPTKDPVIPDLDEVLPNPESPDAGPSPAQPVKSSSLDAALTQSSGSGSDTLQAVPPHRRGSRVEDTGSPRSSTGRPNRIPRAPVFPGVRASHASDKRLSDDVKPALTPKNTHAAELDVLEKLICSQRILLEDMVDTMYAMDGLVRNLLLRTLPHGSETWTVLRADVVLHRRAINMLNQVAKRVHDGDVPVPTSPDGVALGNRQEQGATRCLTDPAGGLLTPNVNTNPVSAAGIAIKRYGSDAEEKLKKVRDRLNLLAPAHVAIEGEPTMRHIDHYREATARLAVFGEEMDRVMDAESTILAEVRARMHDERLERDRGGGCAASNGASGAQGAQAPDPGAGPATAATDPKQQQQQQQQQQRLREQLVLQGQETMRSAYQDLHRRHIDHAQSEPQLYPTASRLWDLEGGLHPAPPPPGWEHTHALSSVVDTEWLPADDPS